MGFPWFMSWFQTPWGFECRLLPIWSWTYALVKPGSVVSRGRRFQPSLPGASLVFRRLETDNARARRRFRFGFQRVFFGGVLKKEPCFLKKQLANCKPFEHFCWLPSLKLTARPWKWMVGRDGFRAGALLVLRNVDDWKVESMIRYSAVRDFNQKSFHIWTLQPNSDYIIGYLVITWYLWYDIETQPIVAWWVNCSGLA